MELIKAAVKLWQINISKTPVRKFNDPDNQPSYFSLFCSVVGALIGTLEDLPVVVASYHLAVTPVCAAPAKKYLKSAAGIAALTASVVNSSWKLLVLHFRTTCEWFSRKEIDRKLLEKLLNLLLFVLFFLFFGLVDQTLTHLSVPRYLLFGFYGFILVAMAIKSCKNLTEAKDCISNEVIIWLKAMIQQVTISVYCLVLFSTIVTFTATAILIIVDKISWESKSVYTGPLGPGWDAKADGAMFVYQTTELQNSMFEIEFFIEEKGNLVQVNKSLFNTINNRIYLGKFEDFMGNHPDPYLRALPCDSALPYLNNVSASIESSRRHMGVSQCLIIIGLELSKTLNNQEELN